MRQSFFRVVLTVALLYIHTSLMAEAQSYAGSSLSIYYPGTSGSLVGDGNAAIGDLNNIQFGSGSLVVGQENYMDGDMWASFGLGYFNNSYGLYQSMMLGTQNGASYVSDSLIAGSYNAITGSVAAFVFGSNNYVEELINGAAIGQGLIVFREECNLVIGKYNVQANPAKPTLFTVANGTGAAAAERSNAFTVFANGDVVIKKRQGDILMGEFGN